jgi:FkbM family methyltransferase
MSLIFPRRLFVKSLLIATPLEGAAKELRWLLGARERRKHPELWELYLEERRLPFVLQKLLTNRSCGVDVGSHIGSFLSLLIKHAPNGTHVAFEPTPAKYKWLRSRFPSVEIFPYAVADETARAIFEENLARPGFSRLRRTDNEPLGSTISYEVQTCRLDDVLCDKDKIDLVKLDIEGGELAALRGATNVIKKSRPAIIFECGSEYYLVQKNLSRKDLYDLITRELGYEIFCFADFLFDKGAMSFHEFRKCGLYPFRAFNFVALPNLQHDTITGRLRS